MASVNKVIILGYLGKDPDVKYLASGDAVVNLSVATTQSWKDKQTGVRKDATEWHRVTVYGKLAQIVGEFLKKGSQAYFEGRLQTRKWQDKQGHDNYTTEIVASDMKMLGSAPKPDEPVMPKNALKELAELEDDIPF